jgi:hypothetical protein
MAYTLKTMETIICRDMKCVQDNVILFFSSLYEEVQSETKLCNKGNNGIEQILIHKFIVLIYCTPIAVAVRSEARTVFARSNTAIVGSNPTEAWMFVCVLCAFSLCLHSLK